MADAREQIFIGSWIEESLMDKIDEIRTGSRSQFCRDALLEKLVSMGIKVAPHEARPPDRSNRGIKYGDEPRGGAAMNESAKAGSRKQRTSSDRNREDAVKGIPWAEAVNDAERGRLPKPKVVGPSERKEKPSHGVS